LPRAETNERKTVLKAFRFSEASARSLEKEAAAEGVSVSAVVNSIVNRYFDWDKKVREFGIAELPKSMLRSLLEGCDDETLARIGRESYAVRKEMAEFFFQDSSPKGILNLLATRSRFNAEHQTRITQEEDKYTIVMRHDLGPKWSIIVKNGIEELVKQSFHVEPHVTAGESVVTTRFRVNPRKLPT
jgi:hypothetical protein